MKLYELPRGALFRLIEDAKTPPGARPLHSGEVLRLGNVDGMYSYCTDEEGNAVHPAALAEVEAVY